MTVHCVDGPHLFIHSSVDRHLGSSHFLALADTAAMNVHVRVFTSPGYVPGRGTGGSYGNSAFNSLRTCHTALRGGQPRVNHYHSVAARVVLRHRCHFVFELFICDSPGTPPLRSDAFILGHQTTESYHGSTTVFFLRSLF